MPFDAAFNSSDVEMSPQAPTRFSNAGKASIDAIIDSAMQDRISSKKRTRELTFSLGTPGVQYNNSLWSNRFQAFREETLGEDVTVAPSGTSMERFLTAIVEKLHTRSPVGVPSYEHLTNSVRLMVNTSIFQYADFKMSPHESLRIRTLLDGLAKEGKLTKEPSREKHWIGATLVTMMVDALFKDALKRGTLNWDVTIVRAASLILLSSLQCRAGDITKARLDDHHLPCLTYRDVRLKLVDDGKDVEHLEARVRIRNEKGHK